MSTPQEINKLTNEQLGIENKRMSMRIELITCVESDFDGDAVICHRNMPKELIGKRVRVTVEEILD